MIPLIGYADKLTVYPGEYINFKISSNFSEPYKASLNKIISADPNPNGPGIKLIKIKSSIDGYYPSIKKNINLGSYGKIKKNHIIKNLKDFSIVANIYNTKIKKKEQGVISFYDENNHDGIVLGIFNGCVGVIINQKNNKKIIKIKEPIKNKKWYKIWASYNKKLSTLVIGKKIIDQNCKIQDSKILKIKLRNKICLNNNIPLIFGAIGNKKIYGFYNGKIESPMIYNKFFCFKSIDEYIKKLKVISPILHWDFSIKIDSTKIFDLGPYKYHGKLHNLPTRGVTGSNWDGSEMNWKKSKKQYGAIYFHEDDIYDFNWKTDIKFLIPKNFKSGVYELRLECQNSYDTITFFVSAAKNKKKSKICLLIPTFTYLIYANHSRSEFSNKLRNRIKKWNAYPHNPYDHKEYGLSTYNFHTDGSGICHASMLRPLLSLKTGYLTFYDKKGSGLRHLQADTHLINWLNYNNIDVDVITDEDLHQNGNETLKNYEVLITCSHPEYHTQESLSTLSNFSNTGGHLIYLGGNGFYWKIVPHKTLKGVVEIRRAEGGIRAWASEPGEYYSAFNGSYGGLWRRNGHPPQKLVGVGFTSNGHFEGSFYRRTEISKKKKYLWIFKDIKENILGNFGLSGGGAAGFELDRADTALGTPENAVILAQSENHNKKTFMLVPEEQLTPFYNLPNKPENELIRSDIVYFKNLNGGKVFSVGSITFCGSLFFNNYNNAISKILHNVITNFIKKRIKPIKY